jgi:hypothetical protein
MASKDVLGVICAPRVPDAAGEIPTPENEAPVLNIAVLREDCSRRKIITIRQADGEISYRQHQIAHSACWLTVPICPKIETAIGSFRTRRIAIPAAAMNALFGSIAAYGPLFQANWSKWVEGICNNMVKISASPPMTSKELVRNGLGCSTKKLKSGTLTYHWERTLHWQSTGSSRKCAHSWLVIAWRLETPGTFRRKRHEPPRDFRPPTISSRWRRKRDPSFRRVRPRPRMQRTSCKSCPYCRRYCEFV